MEERNILWGELVGGLLIVGCSIALVISLRKTLEQVPYFPFLAIGTVTAALIGAGRYTKSHWKLFGRQFYGYWRTKRTKRPVRRACHPGDGRRDPA